MWPLRLMSSINLTSEPTFVRGGDERCVQNDPLARLNVRDNTPNPGWSPPHTTKCIKEGAVPNRFLRAGLAHIQESIQHVLQTHPHPCPLLAPHPRSLSRHPSEGRARKV